MAELTRILYVEDEADIREVTKLALETIGGFTLEVCESGQMALDKAPDFKPDLVLLDVMMPGMDGPTTMAQLKNMPSLAAVPMLFMTAKVQPQEIEQFKSLGAIDVITKPFDPMTLADQIRSLWDRCHE